MTVQEYTSQTLISALAPYVAADRRRSFHTGEKILERGAGAALFADISGSTALAEALVEELGRRRGAEEVTRQLNMVYEALIKTLHQHGGSVIGFSGDAITCWFAHDDGTHAIACAGAMQRAMEAFANVTTPAGTKVELAIKVAVTSGVARRFVVGDPQIQLFDVLAGSVVDELATAEHHAGRGQIVLPETMAEDFKHSVRIVERRVDPYDGIPFAVVEPDDAAIKPDEPFELNEAGLLEHDLTSWVQPEVHARLESGQGDFLAELRPAVALFFKFGGFQFDEQDHAPERLDAYIRIVQRVIQHMGGTLIQLTMGDKGSYGYAAFGAPKAHEDDVDRAVTAAFEIVEASETHVDQIQVGISQGLMRTGAYGSSTRRTYGVLGDEVNVAARLMQAAKSGQILVTESVKKQAGKKWNWTPRPPVQAKGKQAAIKVFQPEGRPAGDLKGSRTSRYSLPMVGRRVELNWLKEQLQSVLARDGRVIGITAAAGMGKTRLAYEFLDAAQDVGFKVFSGECPSYGTQSSYLVWRSMWRALLDIEEGDVPAVNVQRLEDTIAAIDDTLLPRLPLLATILNLSIEDNELTAGFDAKLRKSSLEAMLITLLRIRAREGPLLLFLEDVQWIDALSLDLLKALGRSVVEYPVMILLTYRDEQPGLSEGLGISDLSHFHLLRLSEFSSEEVRSLLEIKVEQLYGDAIHIPDLVVDQISERAQGNPFYVEELLNYLKDRDLDPRDEDVFKSVALPTSLASLILSRIDQLDESQKVTLRLASVIGRIFRERWLTGAFQDAVPANQIKDDLEELNRLELVQFDTPIPELTYLFKHIVTHEVAYDSLPFATRASLHEKLGHYIEVAYESTINQYLDFLAHHYGLSENKLKKRTYLQRAGQAAQKRYANRAAVEYYTKVLPLLEGRDRIEVLANLAHTKDVIGEWDEAEAYFLKAIEAAQSSGFAYEQARFQAELGEFSRKQGLYDEAVHWWDRATAGFSEIDDQAGIGQVLHYQGTLAAQQGDYESAKSRYQLSLKVRQEIEDSENIANLFNNMGVVARMEGDYEIALEYQQRALEIRRKLNDRRLIAISLNNLGNLAVDQGDLSRARNYLDESLTIQREVGDRWAIANCLNNLANVVRAQAEFIRAARLYRESLKTNRELGDLWALAYLMEDIGTWASLQDMHIPAVRLTSAATALRERIGAPRSSAEQEKLDHSLAPVYRALSSASVERESGQGRALQLDEALDEALAQLESMDLGDDE